MLNVRYILVRYDATLPIGFRDSHPLVYADNDVMVFENPAVFPRAWIVHDVRSAEANPKFLEDLDNGSIDGSQVAFINGDLPAVSTSPEGAASDSALVVAKAPESLAIQTSSSADGLLVVSEIYADGWNAYVDGKQVDILRTNHALRGVPLIAGEHKVTLKYEPRAITLGLTISGTTGGMIIVAWSWALIDSRRKRSEDSHAYTRTA
jgi:hypothetical protein